MSDSNRSVVAATGLAQQGDAPSQASAEQQPSENSQGNAGIDEPAPPQVGNFTAIETVAAEPQTQAAEQRAQDDLIAQQDMVFWAMLMFFATLATVIITAVGVWFVKRTLDATLLAVKDTSKATDAMIKANEITKEINAPYFDVTADMSLSFHKPGNDRILQMVGLMIKNQGQTIANRVSATCIVEIEGHRVPQIELVLVKGNALNILVPDGGTYLTFAFPPFAMRARV